MLTDDDTNRERMRTWFKVASPLISGLVIAGFFGELALIERAGPSWWQVPLALPIVLPWVRLLLVPRGKGKADTSGCLPLYACFIVCNVLVHFDQRVWAPPAAAVTAGVCVWAFARLRRRSWPIAVAGCLLAGPAVLLVP